MSGDTPHIADASERDLEELRLSEEKYRGIFEQSVEGIYLHDLEGQILEVNDMACRQSGYSKEELLRLSVFDLHPGGLTVNMPRDAILLAWRNWQPGQRHTVEAEHQRKDGAVYPVEISTGRVHYGDEKRMLAIVKDVSDRKAAENNLELVFDLSLAMICIADINTATFTKVNPAFTAVLGYEEEELLSRSFFDFVHPDDVKPTRKIVEEELRRGRLVLSFENRYRHKDGSYRWLLWNSHPQPELGVTYAVAIDMTELKRTQSLIQNQERIESLGLLAGGIAHDFNNLLVGILGSMDLVRDSLDDPEAARDLLDLGLTSLERARHLTQQLLTFAKGGVPAKDTHLVRVLLKEASELALSGSSVVCEIHVDPADLAVHADANQISQVLNNLFLNARQAMPGPGRVEVVARKARSIGTEIPGLAPGDHVRISITDTGNGIPADQLDKVFDPFFTTKETGSGLGLATSHSIIRRHSGAITVESVEGRGSTFTVYLPMARWSAAHEIRQPTSKPLLNGRALVMDDEKPVREVTRQMLQKLGFEVCCAGNGEEALAVYRQELAAGRRFDVVLLDLTVSGGMGGEAVMPEIAELDPEVIGIVSSGYADNPVMAEPGRYGFRAKIEKPFFMKTLGALLQELLPTEDPH